MNKWTTKRLKESTSSQSWEQGWPCFGITSLLDLHGYRWALFLPFEYRRIWAGGHNLFCSRRWDKRPCSGSPVCWCVLEWLFSNWVYKTLYSGRNLRGKGLAIFCSRRQTLPRPGTFWSATELPRICKVAKYPFSGQCPLCLCISPGAERAAGRRQNSGARSLYPCHLYCLSKSIS